MLSKLGEALKWISFELVQQNIAQVATCLVLLETWVQITKREQQMDFDFHYCICEQERWLEKWLILWIFSTSCGVAQMSHVIIKFNLNLHYLAPRAWARIRARTRTRTHGHGRTHSLAPRPVRIDGREGGLCLCSSGPKLLTMLSYLFIAYCFPLNTIIMVRNLIWFQCKFRI